MRPGSTRGRAGYGSVVIDVLIPTRNRPVEFATTLAGLAAQSGVAFRIVVSDQSDDAPSFDTPSADTLVRALRRRGTDVELLQNLPRRGIAEQRAFLLSRATADAVLYLDDDVWLQMLRHGPYSLSLNGGATRIARTRLAMSPDLSYGCTYSHS